MSDKDFKTIDEQIAILKGRGLTISDEERAREFLIRNNYYRISGYSLTLRNHDRFSKKAVFENIIEIYEFDHELRHILLNYIEEIEVTVKSIYAHEFTRKHGPTGYLDPNKFTDAAVYKKIIDKANDQMNARLKHEAYLKHFILELKQDIPLWAYVDLLTISDISILYSISTEDIKSAVSSAIGIHNKKTNLLGQFMHSMTIIRNLCAHGSRLYNRLFEQKPCLSKQGKALLLVDNAGVIDNAHLYGFVLIMKRLLTPESFSEMKNQMIALTQKYPFVKMKYYGFRDDWKEKM